MSERTPLGDDDFRRAGLYDPEVDAGTGRLELLRWLDEGGFDLPTMVEAMACDRLGALMGDRRLVPGPLLTRAEALAATGLSPARFDELVTAFGLEPIDWSPPGEIGFSEAEVVALPVFDQLSSMFTASEALSLVRVIGSAINRIAEAAVSLFLNDIESPALLHGESELVLGRQVYEAIGLLDGLTEQLDPILRRHVLQATERTRRTTTGDSERFVYRFAIGFVDLVGFTSLSSGMPAPELGAFLRDFEGRAHELASRDRARIVKLIGDEVMFVATDAAAACRAGLALMRGFDDGTVVPRGGLAFGDVLLRGGDYYGAVVNLAARLVDEAVPGEMLATDELASAAVSCTFEPAGRRMVKGFDEPVPVKTLIDA
ncbi:MAG: adenylate/guanylate cyclase domain-containing protein [Actinomycetota bacterium]